MKNYCRYLWIFGIAYTLGIWGFSAYYFHSQVKKMEALFDLANKAKQNDDEYIAYSRQAADLLGKGFYHNNWRAAAVCLSIGTYYLNMDQYDLATPWLHRDEKLNHKKPFQYMEIRTYENLGYAYWKMRLLDNAEYYMQKANEGLEEHRQSNYSNMDKILFYYRFGNIKYQMGKYQEALELFQKSQDLLLSSEIQGLRKNIFLGNNAIKSAYCYYQLNDQIKALRYCELAEGYFPKHEKIKDFIAELFVLYARIYDKSGNLAKTNSSLSSATPYIDYMDFFTLYHYNQLINKLK